MFKFLRSLNLFATIRALRSDLAAAERRIKSQRRSISSWADLYYERDAELIVHVQAIDAFMAERADLKAELAQTNEAGKFLMGEYIGTTLELLAARQSIDESARETLEVIQYVKQAEAALAAGGITLIDGTDGPIVQINQDLFMQRLQDRGHFAVVRETAAA